MNVTWHLNRDCVSLARAPKVCTTASHDTSRTCLSSIILLVQSWRTCTRLSSRLRILGILVFLMKRVRTNEPCGRHIHLGMGILNPCPHYHITKVSHFQRDRNHSPREVEKSAHWAPYQNNQARRKSFTWTRLLHYQGYTRSVTRLRLRC